MCVCVCVCDRAGSLDCETPLLLTRLATVQCTTQGHEVQLFGQEDPSDANAFLRRMAEQDDLHAEVKTQSACVREIERGV